MSTATRATQGRGKEESGAAPSVLHQFLIAGGSIEVLWHAKVDLWPHHGLKEIAPLLPSTRDQGCHTFPVAKDTPKP